MVTIKKQDLKKYTPVKNIDELVDADGSPIEGSKPDSDDNEIEASPMQTSDEFVGLALQPNRRNKLGYTRENTISKDRMKEIVEDIINKNKSNKGFVSKKETPDVNSNGIPDIDELANEMGKPAPVRHAQIFMDDIKTTPLIGDEKAIIINYILSNIDTSDISDEYKNILRKRI